VGTHHKIQASTHHKLGAWQFALKTKDNGQLDELSIHQITSTFSRATTVSPTWHKAWHSWAMINFEAIEYYKMLERDQIESEKSDRENQRNIRNLRNNAVKQHLQNAVKGFMKSIAMSPGKNLQDTLRLLTLFFQYPSDVCNPFMEGLDGLNVDLWLQVIPQIIARIHSNVSDISMPLQNLLTRIGKVISNLRFLFISK
jgi:FKBP12-rapamycin complex-associated protein